jgi:hypothetical protein
MSRLRVMPCLAGERHHPEGESHASRRHRRVRDPGTAPGSPAGRGGSPGHRYHGLYNIVDSDPAPVARWLPYLASVTGAKPPRRVPAWLGRLLAGDLVVTQMTTVRGSCNDKARQQLGWEPRYASWREGFRAWAADEADETSTAAALRPPRSLNPGRIRNPACQEDPDNARAGSTALP